MKIILADDGVIECQAAEVDDSYIITDEGREIPIEAINRFED